MKHYFFSALLAMTMATASSTQCYARQAQIANNSGNGTDNGSRPVGNYLGLLGLLGLYGLHRNRQAAAAGVSGTRGTDRL